MKISYNWLQSYFEKPLPAPEQLKEVFDFHALEVEGLDEVLDQSEKVIETIFDIKVLPDRAHSMLSHKGVAEDLSVLLRVPLKATIVPPPPVSTISTKPLVTNLSPDFCRRYTAQYVEGITVGESPAWMKTYLESIGARSINSIVDATNITMFNMGQPLHAFDVDKVVGAITVRSARDGETIVLLDGHEVTLKAQDYVIADEQGPLAIAGVKGGKRAEVSATTTKIYIESAHFDPSAVRRTSTRLNLRNESSKRFENEITPELTIQGLNDMTALVHELCPTAVCGPVVDIYPIKVQQTVFQFRPSYIEERLGLSIPESEIRSILEMSGIGITMSLPVVSSQQAVSTSAEVAPHSQSSSLLPKVASKSQLAGTWSLTIPFKRLDLTIPEDIVEEVGRAYGLDRIQGILPPPPTTPVTILPIYYLSEQIKNILVAQGFSEVSLYALVAKGDIETVYPLARDKAFLRKNLTDNMLACVERNALNADLLGLDSIRIFEIGHVFSTKGETISLSLGAAQIKKIKGYTAEHIISETIVALSSGLSISLPTPQLVVKGAYVACEFDLSALVAGYTPGTSYSSLNGIKYSDNRYVKISPYPFIVRDIAVFVPDSIQASDVWSVIYGCITEAGARELLARHALFDTFKKENNVSYAFRMVFQSMERTLTDVEIAGIMDRIYAGMKNKTWEVR